MDTELKNIADVLFPMETQRLLPEALLNDLILEIFHGAGLFGRAFEQLGACVVRAGEIELGFDVRMFHPVQHRFDGIIGGSPCQDFSQARRKPPTLDGYGVEMLGEFQRIVSEAQPKWFLHENVPACPDVNVDGYSMQRFILNGRDVGMKQNRARKFQFGSRDGRLIFIPQVKACGNEFEVCCMASEGDNPDKRNLSEFCELMGLPKNFRLPLLHIRQQYRVIGNGVPLPMGLAFAKAIGNSAANKDYRDVSFCGGLCGGLVSGKQTYCSKRCQVRAWRQRNGKR